MNRPRPAIFEDMDDALFDALPPNYALMKQVPIMPVHLAVSHKFRTTQLICEPPGKPISKMLTNPKNGGESDGD